MLKKRSFLVLLDLKAVKQRYIKKYGALSLLPAPNVSIVSSCMYAEKRAEIEAWQAIPLQ
jgi:hypothetical protein